MYGASLMGTVTAVNVGTGNQGSITVKVWSASPALRTYIGQEFTFQFTASTVFLKHMTSISPNDILAGDNVSAMGTLGKNNSFTAQRVSVMSNRH